MMRITRVQVALIAAAASVLTTAIHGSLQAIFASDYSSFGVAFGYVLGRVIGDIPLATVCFVVVYGFLKLSGAKVHGTGSPPSSK